MEHEYGWLVTKKERKKIHQEDMCKLCLKENSN